MASRQSDVCHAKLLRGFSQLTSIPLDIALTAEVRPTTVPYLAFQSLWTHHKMADFPLSQKFTLGILSGSARAQINGLEHARCEFCRCGKTAHLRTMHKYRPLQHASTFTKCTGIPDAPGPLPRPSVDFRPLGFNANHDPIIVCTDGSACPSDLPNVRVSTTWVAVAATQVGGPFYPLCAGVTPGQFRDIIRAETFGVLVCLEHTRACDIHCDNQGVVHMLPRILKTPFDPFTFRAHPKHDLWLRISHLVWSRPPDLDLKSRPTQHFRELRTHRKSG